MFVCFFFVVVTSMKDIKLDANDVGYGSFLSEFVKKAKRGNTAVSVGDLVDSGRKILK